VENACTAKVCGSAERSIRGRSSTSGGISCRAVEAQGVAGEKLEEAEDKDKEDDDDDNDSGSGDDEEEDSGNEGSKYAPAEEGSEGTVNLADDAVAPDNLLDKVKPVQKVSSPFDLLILPIA